jgi:hypothetical protein
MQLLGGSIYTDVMGPILTGGNKSRGSRPVLRGAGGEVPPVYSPPVIDKRGKDS